MVYLNSAPWRLGDVEFAMYHPCDRLSSKIASYLTAWLVDWVDAFNLGSQFRLETQLRYTQASSPGLSLSFIHRNSFQGHSKPLSNTPDLVIEIQASGEELSTLQSTIQQWLKLGTQVGILVHSFERRVTVYHANGDVEVLSDKDVLAIPTLFPAWKLPISIFWISDSP
jgi:Uma2 family endonuclease